MPCRPDLRSKGFGSWLCHLAGICVAIVKESRAMAPAAKKQAKNAAQSDRAFSAKQQSSNFRPLSANVVLFQIPFQLIVLLQVLQSFCSNILLMLPASYRTSCSTTSLASTLLPRSCFPKPWLCRPHRRRLESEQHL